MAFTNYSAMAGLAAMPGDYGAPEMQDYESGRCVYDCESMTGLNVIPVTRLAGYALNGAVFTGAELLPLSPEEVILNLLIDGSWLELNGSVQSHIIGASQSFVLQHVRAGEEKLTREWMRTDGLPMTDGSATGAGWVVTDYSDYGTELQKAESEPQFVPDDAVRYHFNPLSPAGVLYPARRAFERLEEIAVLIREAQLGPGAKTAIMGTVRNRNQVERDLRSRQSYFFTGGETTLDRMTSTAVVDQLASEFDRLKPLYMQLVYCVDTTNPVQRPSGADRELILDPMFTYVDYVRRMADGVLALYGASWTYESNKPVQPQAPQVEQSIGDTDNGE